MAGQQLRPAVFLAALTFSLACLSLYSMQEAALARMESRNLNSPPTTSHDIGGRSPQLERTSEAKVWVTMAVCWGENAQVHGKEHFPYTEAALRSVNLWHTLTHARVLLTIVHSGKASKELLAYQKRLEELGADVSLAESKSDLGCVLTSQLIRLLAFNNPLVNDEDIIVTADVTAAFPPATLCGKN